MATVDAGGRSLYYATAGAGETVAFVGDAGFGAWQWGHQYEGVAGPREALVWDPPGTGRSDDPPDRCTVDALAADLEVVLGDAGADRAHLVGAGLGGMVALRYAREYGRARSLALFGTAASGGAVDRAALHDLHPDADDAAALRESLAGAFSADFRDRSAIVEAVLEWRRAEDATGEALTCQLEAMLDFNAGPLHEVSLPAVVFHGLEDPVVTPDGGAALAEGLPRGEFVAVEGRHLAHVEAGSAVTDRLVGFHESVEAAD